VYFDRFYGFATLTTDTADAGARALNALPPLSEAWRYPTRPSGELEAETRRIVGPDAKIERAWVAVRVAVARCEASDPARWALELAALDTRVHCTTVALNDDGSTRFEALVWVANPHKPVASKAPRAQRKMQWESGAQVASGACPCGAKHVAFFCSTKSNLGDELETASTPCLACGRATLTVSRVNRSYGVEIYLRDQLPLGRAIRLWCARRNRFR